MLKPKIVSRSVIAVMVLAVALTAWGFAAAQDDSAPPFLGIGLQAVDNGIQIQEIVPGSPAEQAGLQIGDIITQINGKDVTAASVQGILQDYAIGDTVTLNVDRADETLELEATLAARPEQPEVQFQMSERPVLGVRLENTDDGVVIREITSGSAAEKAGLQVDDVLVKIGDVVISEAQQAVEAVQALKPGDDVEIQVTRNGESVSVTATLETMPMEFNFQGMPFDFNQLTQQGRLGVEFISLNAQVAQERGLEQTEGALVTKVSPDSPAAKAGLQTDDIITAVNGEKVDEEHTLRDRLVAYEAGDTITLDVQRGDEALSMDIVLEQTPMSELMPSIPFFNEGQGFQFGGPNGFQFPVQPPDANPVQPNL